MRVHDVLNYGLDNAIPTKDLVQILGLQSDRELRKMVERERGAGAVILSDCHRGGSGTACRISFAGISG